MRFYLTLFLKIIILVTIFSAQLCLIRFEQNMILNPLLIAYSYGLFTRSSPMTLALLLFFLDALTFMSTGIFGLTIISMVPVSIFLFRIRENFYNKVVAPCLMITAYQLIMAIILFAFLSHPLSILNFLWGTLINSLVLVLFWGLTNQPFHN